MADMEEDKMQQRVLAQINVEEGGWAYVPESWLSREEIKKCEKRWADRSYRFAVIDEHGDCNYQCGGCHYFAAAGADYGICFNEKSPLDGMVTFEHGGCAYHSGIKIAEE